MVRVPAGEFRMGSAAGPPSAQPPHRVYLSEFQIGVTEVTVGEFRAYVEDSGIVPGVWRGEDPSADLDDPGTGILWSEALAFCQWYGLRLPTEAEWEKAARGDDGRIYPWGDKWDSSRANTASSGHEGVVFVGSFPEGASPYGLLDMSGNAQEWVSDYFAPSYYLRSPYKRTLKAPARSWTTSFEAGHLPRPLPSPPYSFATHPTASSPMTGPDSDVPERLGPRVPLRRSIGPSPAWVKGIREILALVLDGLSAT